jgi:methyltransferase (TIGR00027 family)
MKMDELQASRTAIGVAVLRAAHQLFDAEPKILVDPIAIGLVPEASEMALRADAQRLQQPFMRQMRANFVLRSRFAEDRLEAAARRGVTQYVVLGAGLDTFAYRQPTWARHLTILEIDHPASQQFKIATLKSADVEVPGNVQFFPIDFEVDTIADRFALAPLDRDRPIFVSWLGVTQYLTRDAVGTTLRALVQGGTATELVLSYITDDWTAMGADEREAIESAQALAASLGEPWLSKFSAGAMADLLAASGFSRIEPFTFDEANAQYFGPRGDKLQPPRGTGLVYATT